MDELLELASRLPSQTSPSRRREKIILPLLVFFSAERGALLEGRLEPRETCHSLSMY
jgi:hypothetical protein